MVHNSTFVQLLLSTNGEVKLWVDMDAETAKTTLLGTMKRDYNNKSGFVRKVTILHELTYMCFSVYSNKIVSAGWRGSGVFPSFAVRCTSLKDGEEKAKQFLKWKYPEAHETLRFMYKMNLTPDQTELNYVDHLITS